jgi:hypothetical protein
MVKHRRGAERFHPLLHRTVAGEKPKRGAGAREKTKKKIEWEKGKRQEA